MGARRVASAVSKEPVSFRAEPELVDRIEALAAKEGETVSEFLRETVEEAVEREEVVSKPVAGGGRFRLTGVT